MKSIAQLLGLAFLALVFSSCCGVPFAGCGKCEKTAHAGCENDYYITKKVTKYKESKRTVYPSGKGGKGGVPYEVTDRIPYEVEVKEAAKCGYCGSTYCPEPACCDIVSKAVLKRATAQGGTGEPHIGTIPTMKVLAE